MKLTITFDESCDYDGPRMILNRIAGCCVRVSAVNAKPIVARILECTEWNLLLTELDANGDEMEGCLGAVEIDLDDLLEVRYYL